MMYALQQLSTVLFYALSLITSILMSTCVSSVLTLRTKIQTIWTIRKFKNPTTTLAESDILLYGLLSKTSSPNNFLNEEYIFGIYIYVTSIKIIN